MDHYYQHIKQYCAARWTIQGLGDDVAEAGWRGAVHELDCHKKGRRRARADGFLF
jgi:hypothetical protein